jgi:hypothetical protein
MEWLKELRRDKAKVMKNKKLFYLNFFLGIGKGMVWGMG